MMRKIILIFILTISFSRIGFAQMNEAQMEALREQMQQLKETFQKQFDGNAFFFDTTFVQQFGNLSDSTFVRKFEFRDFDNGTFPFDTSFVQEFRMKDLDGLDTFFIRQWTPQGNWDIQNMPLLEEMMKDMQKRFESGEFRSLEPFDKKWLEEWSKQLPHSSKPQPAPQKKRKTTIL